MNQRILMRYSLPNERGQKLNCEICNIKFQLLVKVQHQCKRCLRSICQQCGPERRTVYDADGSSSLHRCCLVCIKEIEEINEYRARYKLCFGQDSEFMAEWLNKLNKDRVSYDSILNQFSDNITSVTNENTIRFKRQSEAMLKDLMDGYNYSLRHFIQVVTEGVNPQIIETKIRNVLLGIFARVKTLPYIPELIYLTVFFLCFANEAHSYFIITRMIEKIYPQYVRVNKMQKDNLLASTLKTILEMYRICVGKVDRNELEVIAQYLQARFSVYVLSFTLNVCSMPSSFFIINQMLKTGSCLPFYKGIAAIISFCREEVASYKYFSEVEIPILRTINAQKLRNCFIQFEKSDAKFEVTNEVFDSVEHRKLHEKYKQMESLYSKSEKSLAEREAKIKELISQLYLKKKQLDMETEKNKKLQSDILTLSSSLPKLLKFEEMSQLHEATMKRNQKLEEKCAELEKLTEKMEKEKAVEDKYRRNWAKLEDDYNQQIVNLKTKNEIMQIQVSAKQIDFNTSFIEKKFQEKNVEITMLNEQIKHLKNELEFYKLKVLEKSYNKHLKDNKNPRNTIEQERQKEFEKHIQNSKQLVDVLKKQLDETKRKLEESEAKVKTTEEKNEELQKRVKQIEEISKVIQEIPQEYNYVEAIEQIQRVAEKETNFMKKKTLESIKDSFTKCYKELRFRSIDCRIKEDKIKNSFLVKLFNPDSVNSVIKADEAEAKKNDPADDSLFSILKSIDENSIDQNTNKQCTIM